MDESLAKQVRELHKLEKQVRIRLNGIPSGAASLFLEDVFGWVVGAAGNRKLISGDGAERAIFLCGGILRRIDIDVVALIGAYASHTCNRHDAGADLEGRVRRELSRLREVELQPYERSLVSIVSSHAKKNRSESPQSLAVLHFAEKFLNELK